MPLLPDDLCLLLEQMNLSPSSTTSSTPSISGDETPPSGQESMTTTQRLDKLTQLRTSMHQHLILLLTNLNQVEESNREEVDAEVEEYKDLLDGLDVLIANLRKRKDHLERETNFDESTVE